MCLYESVDASLLEEKPYVEQALKSIYDLRGYQQVGSPYGRVVKDLQKARWLDCSPPCIWGSDILSLVLHFSPRKTEFLNQFHESLKRHKPFEASTGQRFANLE